MLSGWRRGVPHSLIVIFISQIGPDLRDIRLPNPLDLKPFDKTCFLNNSEVQFRSAS